MKPNAPKRSRVFIVASNSVSQHQPTKTIANVNKKLIQGYYRQEFDQCLNNEIGEIILHYYKQMNNDQLKNDMKQLVKFIHELKELNNPQIMQQFTQQFEQSMKFIELL